MNWFDIVLITLIFHYCWVMLLRENEQFETDSDGEFRTGAAVTLGLLWIAVIYFFKSTFLDFAVFVGNIQYLTRHLFIFSFSLIVILIAFAQMFLIVFRNSPSCEECNEDDEFPHCTFENSFLTVSKLVLLEVYSFIYEGGFKSNNCILSNLYFSNCS